MIWITVTPAYRLENQKEYINAETLAHIAHFDSSPSQPKGRARLYFVGDDENYMTVQETPSEVMILINKERELIRKLSGQ